MGTLRSASDCSGMVINGVLLGEPSFTDANDEEKEPLFIWDDSRFPQGLIEDSGTITLDEVEEI
jgi:hypothetical protein